MTAIFAVYWILDSLRRFPPQPGIVIPQESSEEFRTKLMLASGFFAISQFVSLCLVHKLMLDLRRLQRRDGERKPLLA